MSIDKAEQTLLINCYSHRHPNEATKSLNQIISLLMITHCSEEIFIIPQIYYASLDNFVRLFQVFIIRTTIQFRPEEREADVTNIALVSFGAYLSVAEKAHLTIQRLE